MTDPCQVNLITILVVVNDPDDYLLLKMTIDACHLINPITFIGSPDELLDYLHHSGEFTDPQTSPTPGLILINPLSVGMDGIKAIRQIQKDPTLSDIPIVLIITSQVEREFIVSKKLSADAFLDLPLTPESLYMALRSINKLKFGISV